MSSVNTWRRFGLSRNVMVRPSKHLSSIYLLHAWPYSIDSSMTMVPYKYNIPNIKTTDIWENVPTPIATLLCFRVAWEILTAEVRPQTHIAVVPWYHILCILQCCTYIQCISCTTTQDNKTHTAYDRTTHQMMASLPRTHCFIRTKILCHDLEQAAAIHSMYLHIAVSFQLQWTL